MAPEKLVEGPAWVASGLDESRGLYPLSVEPAVGRLVQRLLPGIITTTTSARYYALHTLAWSDAEARGLAAEDAEAFVRRCEVVMAAASWAHGQQGGGHRRRVPAAHGEDRIPRFIANGVLDLARAAAPGGYSQGGFAGTYEAPERVIGLLRGRQPPRRGQRASLEPLRAGLGPVTQLARKDALSTEEMADAVALCPCCAADAPDGIWLRHVLFEEARPDVENDHNRQISALMLLEALEGGPHRDPEATFRLRHGFGPDHEGDAFEPRARRGWRAAILRNYSVSAWRHLWSWLSEQLAADAMLADDLADRLADAVGGGRVRELVDGLPPRVGSDGLLPVEEQLARSADPVPQRSLRQLAMGALRLRDLSGETLAQYLGTDRDDLGPLWVEHQLAEHADARLSDFARDLVDTMLRRARRVAHRKMRLSEDLRPYVPTRLRDRDGLLSVVDVEPHAEVSLRGWTLAQILSALGAVDRPDAQYSVTSDGVGLREEIARRLGSAS